MRKRSTLRGLTNSRIYQRGNRFYLFSAKPIENPATGKVTKWIPLCNVSDGERIARSKADEVLHHNDSTPGKGDLPARIEIYRLKVLRKRSKDSPSEPARKKVWDELTKEITRQFRKIAEAFADFDVDQVMPVDIAEFVDQWEGQRMAQVWHSRLSGFFAYACRKGWRNDNPCREVAVEKPASRKRYITHKEYHAVRDAALIGKDGKKTPSGEMLQCYMDLCYLLYQRTTEIRLLKWSQIDMENEVIHFTPTKTERSSGISVDLPITQPIQAVLERVRKLGTVKGIYVIHTRKGQPYNTRGIRSAFSRACERAGIEGATLKDMRAKALTDAKNSGFKREQLQVAAAHTDPAMTDEYIKNRLPEKSEVIMSLPPKN
jgi:integrase